MLSSVVGRCETCTIRAVQGPLHEELMDVLVLETQEQNVAAVEVQRIMKEIVEVEVVR